MSIFAGSVGGPLLAGLLIDANLFAALPHHEFDTWDAAMWFAGMAQVRDPLGAAEVAWLDENDDCAMVPLRFRHDQLVEDLSGEGLWSSAAVGIHDESGGKIDRRATHKLQRDLRDGLADDLRAVRLRMRELGLIPPELPAELASVDDQESGRVRRR